MPNIDTSSIEGFAEMTAEQKLDAVLKLEIPEAVDLSGWVKKSVFDAKASEAAELSKQLKGKMTADEAAEAERTAALAKLQQQIDEGNQTIAQLQKEKLEASYKAKYLATAGFDEALAEETAKALANGDMDKVFANQQKANEAAEKKLREELIKQDPHPSGNGGGNGGEEADNVKQAREIGKQKAEALKAGNSLDKFKI